MAIVTSADVLLQLGITTPTSAQNSIIAASIKWAEASVRRYLKYDPVYRQRTEYYPTSDHLTNREVSIWEANENSAYLRYQQNGVSNELLLKHLPIRSIDALFIDYDGRFGTKANAFSNDTLKVSGEDYWARFDGVDDDGNPVCRDGILLSHGLWPSEPGSIKIVYTAGYTEAELSGSGIAVDGSPIAEAIIFEATRKAKQTIMLAQGAGTSGATGVGFTAGSISSEKIGDYSYNLSSSSGGSASGSSGAGLYDGVKDLSSESMERLADFVNIGLSLTG